MVVVSVALGLLWLAPGCLASSPIKGGRYAGKWSTGSRKGERYIAFNVDDGGRAFVSDRRLVLQGSEIAAPCGPGPWDLGGSRRPDVGFDYTTLSAGTPVRVGGGGRFFLSTATAAGGAFHRLTITGGFLKSGRLARGSFAVSRTRPGRPPCDESGTFWARFTGQRHLSCGRCPPGGATTVVQDRFRRVYEQRYVNDPVVRNDYGDGGAVYGCDRRTGRSWFLAGDDTSGGLASYWGEGESFIGAAMAGDMVGLSLAEGAAAGADDDVRVVSLKTGRVRLDADLGSGIDRDIARLAVNRSGAAAWILCTSDSTPRKCAVVGQRRPRARRRFAAGEGVEPTSLDLRGSRLSWRQNGKQRTARLR
ncbi:MAG TPA: hypothetical protein VHR88_08800 [Solirubrobacteraceae bacterium]|nr:hypothetical protein [Solirubrobacteraceae bacterium]